MLENVVNSSENGIRCLEPGLDLPLEERFAQVDAGSDNSLPWP